MLKNLGLTLSFKHLPQDLANLDARKTMIDPSSYYPIYTEFELYINHYDVLKNVDHDQLV